MGSVHAQNEPMKDEFSRCHEKTAVQVCTLTIMHYCLVTVNTHALIAYATADIDNLVLAFLRVYGI
jgi:hypothetical protein